MLGERLNFGVITNDDLAHCELLDCDLGFCTLGNLVDGLEFPLPIVKSQDRIIAASGVGRSYQRSWVADWQGSPVYDIDELVRHQDLQDKASIRLTSDSAFLMISTGASGLPPGVRGMPSAARTSFFGGGRREHVMKRTALMDVLEVV